VADEAGRGAAPVPAVPATPGMAGRTAAPRTMRAAVLDGYGGSERLRLARNGEVPRPEPGGGQVLIRVRAAGVNPLDWKIRRGRMRLLRPARFPLILGFDAAGEIAAVGPEVTAFEIGDPVYALLDSRHGGAYAEYALALESSVAPLPPALSFEEAAALPLAGLTALQALRDKGELGAGERVLIHGAAGGVGHLAVQIATALDAEVTAVAAGRHKDFAFELGADRFLAREEDDFTLLDETFAVVFDAVGRSSYKAAAPLLDPGGGVYVTTRLGPALFFWQALTSLAGLARSPKRARGVSVRPSGADLETLARLVQAGRLRPVIDRVLPLEEAARAHDLSESGATRGKIVLRV
jgi:NADPH:quinone reductase-like Zn-dependent oxidoreductase